MCRSRPGGGVSGMRTTTTAPESTRRMIFIGGVHGRTGTSLVKRLVCQHPQVSAVAAGETRMFEAISELWPLLSTDVGYTPGGGTNGLKAFAEHVRDRKSTRLNSSHA